jgi:hypothetical protein
MKNGPKDKNGSAQSAWASQIGAKAWAGEVFAHLGRIQSKATCIVHLRSTITSVSWSDKSGARLTPRKPQHHFSSPPYLCPNLI